MFYLGEYELIFGWFFVSFLLGLGMLVVSFLLTHRTLGDLDKYLAYECGFDPFEHSKMRFDVRYYLLAILFLIFDLELVFLLPCVIGVYCFSFFSFWVLIGFVVILGLGFYYEWLNDALAW